MSTRFQGQCLCGAVAFEVDAFAGAAGHCHCSMCRKFHGAAYATIVGVERSAFHWVRGQALVSEYEASNRTVRSFCSTCGSSLFFASPKAPADVIEVALAAFDADVPVHPDAHIFRGSAANWAKVCDGLPEYIEGRSGPRVRPL